MNEMEWTRIPSPIDAEADRRTLLGILGSIGLEVRIVKIKATSRGSSKKYVEFRPLSEVDHEL